MPARTLSIEQQIRHDVIVRRRGDRRPSPRPVKPTPYQPRHLVIPPVPADRTTP